MAKKTVLQIVQDVLNDTDGDDVNSINDTVEATQIANIVRSVYEDMSTNRNWPFQKKLIQLEGLSDTDRPTHMRLPDECKEIKEIKYNTAQTGITKKSYTEITYLEPDVFLTHINGRNSDETNIDVIVETGGADILIRNDIAPVYWTSFNDDEVVFDSYDGAVDNTMQASKTQVMAYVEEAMTLTDDSYPPIPNEVFPALIAEVKATVSFKLNQTVDAKEEKKARVNRSFLSRKAFKTRGGVKYPQHRGRRSVK